MSGSKRERRPNRYNRRDIVEAFGGPGATEASCAKWMQRKGLLLSEASPAGGLKMVMEYMEYAASHTGRGDTGQKRKGG